MRLLFPLLVAALAAAPAAHAAPDDPAAACTYVGVVELDNHITYTLAGHVRAATAIQTSVHCELENSAGTVVLHASQTCYGSACAAASSAGGFPVAAVKACVSASATYVDGSVRTLPRTC